MEKHTSPPWAWQRFGDTYMLTAQHGMREIIIGAINHSPQMKYPIPAMNINGRMEAIDPKHPNAKILAMAPQLYEVLEKIILAKESAMEPEDLFDVLKLIEEAKKIMNENV